ncbi:MAG: MaoC family dehydratase N-terminal domain-containing protein [Actinomycetota bacterium]
MTFNADLIGKRYEEVRLSVTADAVTRFAHAVGEHNPVFLDATAAKEAGFPNQVAPPAIMALLQIVAVQEITADPAIGAGFDGIVHGEQEYEWERQVVVGDELSTIPTIGDIRSKGSVAFMDVQLDVTDASGEMVVRSKSTLVHFEGGVGG